MSRPPVKKVNGTTTKPLKSGQELLSLKDLVTTAKGKKDILSGKIKFHYASGRQIT